MRQRKYVCSALSATFQGKCFRRDGSRRWIATRHSDIWSHSSLTTITRYNGRALKRRSFDFHNKLFISFGAQANRIAFAITWSNWCGAMSPREYRYRFVKMLTLTTSSFINIFIKTAPSSIDYLKTNIFDKSNMKSFPKQNVTNDPSALQTSCNFLVLHYSLIHFKVRAFFPRR